MAMGDSVAAGTGALPVTNGYVYQPMPSLDVWAVHDRNGLVFEPICRAVAASSSGRGRIEVAL